MFNDDPAARSPRPIIATFGLCIALIAVYMITGPTVSTNYMDTIPEAFAAVFRHGSLQHLSGNVLVIFLGGAFTEERLGAVRMLILAFACAALGTIAQFSLVGPHFVGASAIAYGLMAYGCLADRNTRRQYLLLGIIVLMLTLEWAYLSSTVAIYAHIGGAAVGGTLAMFESLFGSKTPALKPMQLTHIARVAQIIDETDSDDAREAEEQFLNGDTEGMFVLVQKGEILGVTGYSLDNQVPDIAWLSWTYLAKEHKGAGLGGQMLNDLLGKLNGYGVRKIFIATSDYDDFGKQIYADAHKMYADFGADVELTIPNYHNVSEAKIVYGLQNPEFVENNPPTQSENTGFMITGIADEPETDRVVGLSWEERPVGLAGIDYALDTARQKMSRMVVLAIPSDLSEQNAEALRSHGFEICGELKDYYKSALHQVCWVCSLGL